MVASTAAEHLDGTRNFVCGDLVPATRWVSNRGAIAPARFVTEQPRVKAVGPDRLPQHLETMTSQGSIYCCAKQENV